MIKILAVDDHPVVCEGIKSMCKFAGDIEVCDTAQGMQGMFKTLEKKRYDVILLDISLTDTNGLEALDNLQQISPNAQVVVLSMYDDEEYVIRALTSGANGYVTKQSMADELITAIRTVHAGGNFISPGLSRSVASFLKNRTGQKPHEKLSAREREVLCLFVAGRTTKEIARTLFLSPNTVSTYRSRIKEKMGMGSMAELIRYSIEHKLCPCNATPPVPSLHNGRGV